MTRPARQPVLPGTPPAETEADILHAVLVAITALPGAMFWRQNRGLAVPVGRDRPVQFGVDGMGDIGGCYRGHAVQIETKSRRGTQRTTQVRFQNAWERANGVYIVARSAKEALDALQALPNRGPWAC